MNRPLLSRRTAILAARAGTAASAVMLAITLFTLSPGGTDPAGAAGTQVGPAAVIHPEGTGEANAGDPLAGGDSTTPFSLYLGAGPECPGDSANDGYRVTSFMVPRGTDLTTLEFDPLLGPVPADLGTYATFRQPLFQVEGSTPYVGAQTAAATTPPGPGPVVNIPAFNFAPSGIAPGNIPAGAYTIGIACTDADTELTSFWAVEIVVATAASGGGPAAITWTVPEGSTTTTAGTGSSTSTTASGGSTSTTAAGGSTSTTASGGSTSTTASGGSTSSTSGSGTGGTSGGTTGGVSGSGGSLPTTGSSPAALVMWGVFLVVCGRITVVLSRPPKVKTPRA